MQQESTDRKEEAVEREMGNFSPSLENVFDPWTDIQASCRRPSQLRRVNEKQIYGICLCVCEFVSVTEIF